MDSAPFLFYNHCLSLICVDIQPDLLPGTLGEAYEARLANSVNMVLTIYTQKGVRTHSDLFFTAYFYGKCDCDRFTAARLGEVRVGKNYFQDAEITVRNKKSSVLSYQHAPWSSRAVSELLMLLRFFPRVKFSENRTPSEVGENEIYARLREMRFLFNATLKVDPNEADFLKWQMEEGRLQEVTVQASFLANKHEIDEIFRLFFESPTLRTIHMWNETYLTNFCQFMPACLMIWTKTAKGRGRKRVKCLDHTDSMPQLVDCVTEEAKVYRCPQLSSDHFAFWCDEEQSFYFA